MNPPLSDFLAARLAFPGLVAWSLRLPDKTLDHHCQTKWITATKLDEVLARMLETVDMLIRDKLAPVRLNWIFEGMRLHLALRRDGTCLAILVQPAPQMSGANVERAMEEFLQMSAG